MSGSADSKDPGRPPPLEMLSGPIVMVFRDSQGGLVEVDPGSLAESGYPIDPETGDDLGYLGLASRGERRASEILWALVAAWDDESEVNLEDRIEAAVAAARKAIQAGESPAGDGFHNTLVSGSVLPTAIQDPDGRLRCPRCGGFASSLVDYVPRMWEIPDKSEPFAVRQKDMAWDDCSDCLVWCQVCEAEAKIPDDVLGQFEYL